ncbi:hypothetical protein L3X38_010164 [Prunus dulcis]|uniref:Uncharacterized protein n=1 Tax=Prunus dulcis TaxID=3755 RepID=A0AAD4WGM8_PRUDU|nr:hypothetical protein L3X38_010164 [Prunus dulcis]
MISESKLLHWPFCARFCKGSNQAGSYIECASYKWLSCNMWCHQMLCKKQFKLRLELNKDQVSCIFRGTDPACSYMAWLTSSSFETENQPSTVC